jgi:hypothetical protein
MSSSSPLAKQAVIRTTPDKRKQHKADATVAWLLDDGKDAKHTQSKHIAKIFKGLMVPSGAALDHPEAPLLLELATVGCPADVGEQWTMEMIEAAIRHGAHPSAMQPEAAAQLRAETLEKVEQGYARLVLWEEIQNIRLET